LLIVITGGAGFIGSEFVRQAYKLKGFEILVIDSLTYAGHLENISECMNEIEFAKVDIVNREVTEAAIKRSLEKNSSRNWLLINFAAESHVDKSITNSSPFIDTNIKGTTNLLDIALKYKAIKFIQISTDEIYGTCFEQSGFLENAPWNPSSAYAASKASAELVALSYKTTHQLPVVITRASNNFGPFQTPEKLIPRLTIRALKGKSLPIYGDGLQIREWSFVSDHVENLIKLIQDDSRHHIYNIGSHTRIENINIARQICKILGISENLIEHVEDRKGHDVRYALDSGRFSNEFSLVESNFTDSLEATVNWYRDNLELWPPTQNKAFSALEEQYLAL